MKKFKSISFWIILPLVIIMIMAMTLGEPKVGTKTIDELEKELVKQNVDSIEIGETSCIAEIDGKKYTVEINQINLLTLLGEEIDLQIKEGNLKVTNPAPETVSWWVSLLPTLLMFIVIGLFTFSIMRQQGGGHGVGNFGKSKAKNASDSKVTFDDVAGADE